MNTKIRKLENFHILLWLLKDICWVTLSKSLGVFMILPTLGLAIYITYIHRQDKTELAHNLSICFWIAANSTWMIGEFYFDDSLRNPSVLFFPDRTCDNPDVLHSSFFKEKQHRRKI